jgi:cobalt-zinc-cadmium efflux system outer membrane protein
MPARRLWFALGLVLLQGCCHPLPDYTDPVVRDLASRIRDVEPASPAEQALAPRAVQEKDSPPPAPAPDSPKDATSLPAWDRTVLPAAAQLKGKPARPKRQLVVPPPLPGSNAPPLEKLPREETARERELARIYPALPPLPAEPQPAPGPEGRPLTLADLQQLAVLHNPSVKNAVAAVEAARGAVRQAGAYPNPNLFWEADTVGTSGAGYQGGGIDQPIKGANKLKLQQAMAEMELRNAKVALRRAQSDLATQVRSTYFAVLLAQENMRVSRALAQFTDGIFSEQRDLVTAGLAALYEPMQVRPVALQARFNLTQAINQYQASWKQLAAALGLPEMCPTELVGRVDLPVPVFCYDKVLAQVLSRHTDVLTAENSLQRARYALELARVTPFPDFDLHVLVQKDYTTPPHDLVYSAALTFPIPIWDQNKGAIHQAHNQLIQATLQPQQNRLQLTNTLADAFNRYLTNREQVAITRSQVEDQVRVFPMLYRRYWETFPLGEVTFGDVVTALQTLTGYVTTYLTALGLQWTAVVDVANLLQTDDLFGLGPLEEMTPVPDLDELLPLPECSRGKPPACRGRPQATEQGPSKSAPGTVEGARMPADSNLFGDPPE